MRSGEVELRWRGLEQSVGAGVGLVRVSGLAWIPCLRLGRGIGESEGREGTSGVDYSGVEVLGYLYCAAL